MTNAPSTASGTKRRKGDKPMTMSVYQARKIIKDHGLVARQGDYSRTIDNRINRWYLDVPGKMRDRRGPGYRTQQEAADSLISAFPAHLSTGNQ